QLFNTTTIPTDYSLGLNSSFQYDLTQVGGFFSFTSPLSPSTSVNYGIKAVTSTFGPPLTGTPPPGSFPFTPGQVNALIVGAAVDSRDDPVNPATGDHLQLIGEFALRVLGGSFTFQKYELDYAHFIPVTAADTLVGHMHLGYSATPLPIQEQLYLGGQAALRGYVTSRFRGDEMAFAPAVIIVLAASGFIAARSAPALGQSFTVGYVDMAKAIEGHPKKASAEAALKDYAQAQIADAQQRMKTMTPDQQAETRNKVNQD